MRILILSFYFHPDLSAGSFRATALARELGRQLGRSGKVEVLTSSPNRYHSFRAESPAAEVWDNVSIRRIAIPPHRNRMADQARSYSRYAAQVLRSTHGRSYDVVLATSSRLMTAVLGGVVARRTHSPLYLDLRDIFPDTMSDVLKKSPQRLVLPFLRMAEAWVVRSAHRVNLVSPGFLDYFRAIRDDLAYRTFTNGVDEAFLNVRYEVVGAGPDRPTVILYAGNVGQGQGLERIVPEAAARLGDRAEFWIVGDGGRRALLHSRLEEKGLHNVRLLDPVPQQELVELYRQADVLFLHLNRYRAFRKVLPSKIFEYAATGKPILAGVDGYARSFLKEHVDNSAIFDPCDAAGLLDGLRELKLTVRSRNGFVEKYHRKRIIEQMASDILNLAGR